MKRILLTIVAGALSVCLVAAQAQPQGQAQPPAQAQPGQQAQPAPAKKQPQAKSKDEYDALQKLNDPALPPDQKLQLAEEFLVKYPNTELKSFVYRTEMTVYQQKNDFVNMLDAGDKVLKEDPDDAITLIMLASAIPERVRENDLDKEEKLKKAEDFSNRGLAAVDKLAKPNPQMPDADWDKARNDARGQIYAALGLVALQRKQYSVAEGHFRKATDLQNQKDPIVFWRLGLAYQSDKKYEEARDAYKQSVALGGVKVGGRDLAAEELQKVDDFLKKRQSGPGATPQTPPPGNPPGGKP